MKRFIVAALAILTLAVSLAGLQAPHYAAAATAKSEVCAGISAASGNGCDTKGNSLNGIIGALVNILSAVIGVIAVIMVIFAGYRYITSGGDSAKVSSAKNTLLYAIIGLIVVALAQFIVKFVIDRAIKA